MFSNRACASVTKSLVLADLQSAGSLTTDPIEAHGLLWSLVFSWKFGVVVYRLGYHQLPKSMVGVAVRASVVIESGSARLKQSFNCTLVCTEGKYTLWYKFLLPSHVWLLAEDGALKISAFLEVFKPISFKIVPSAAYRIRPPPHCIHILGVDHEGTVYALRSLLSVANSSIKQWCVYGFRPFNAFAGIILARLNIRVGSRVSSGFDRDNKRISVRQKYDNNTSLQLDIVDGESGHHTTRTYTLQDQDLEWSAATPHKQGWLCIASGVREGEEDPLDRNVHHRFWLLGDDGQLELLTELVEHTPLGFPETAASVNGKYYCMVTTPGYRCFMFVSSWEQPHTWQPYEMAPYPNFADVAVCSEWGHLFMVGRLLIGPSDERQDALFELRFEGADCLLEPYLVLPKGVLNWSFGEDGFVGFVRGEFYCRFYGLQPSALKNRAVLAVAKMLSKQEGIPTWRQKLTRLLGQAANDYLN